MYNTENFDQKTFEPKCFTSNGSVTLKGVEIKYHTVCEDNVFYDNGNPIASIFSYSYFRDDVDTTNRPVIFAFNGGPGSSSMYVHAGFLVLSVLSMMRLIEKLRFHHMKLLIILIVYWMRLILW